MRNTRTIGLLQSGSCAEINSWRFRDMAIVRPMYRTVCQSSDVVDFQGGSSNKGAPITTTWSCRKDFCELVQRLIGANDVGQSAVFGCARIFGIRCAPMKQV